MLLAFGFASPLLLWGLLLAGVPLLIQWLHRRQYTHRVWAAMRFLRAATESQTRRLRMESLLLLCVRTLILLLVVLALAEPYLQQAGWLAAADTSTHTLILLDTSLSMQAVVDGATVGERAKDAAREIVRSGQPGDSYQLVTIAARPEAIIRQPSFAVDDVLAEVDRLAITETFGDVAEAIVRAERLLRESSATGRQRIAIISDFQRSNWNLEEPTAQERTRQALIRMAQRATVSLVPVGTSDAGNVAVQDVRAESSLVSVGAPVSITAQFRNLSPQPLRQQRVQLVEEGRILQTQSVDVAPYAEAAAVFASQFSEAGEHALQIRLENDVLPPDNDRWLTVQVKEQLAVLLVDGRASGGDLEGATDFVELALRPSLTADSSDALSVPTAWVMQPTVISEAELVRTDLSQFDCIFVCDVPFLSDDEFARLSSFVKGGGGLVIGMGDQVQLDAYSRQLDAEGAGLLPVQLVRVVGGDDEDSEPFHFAEPIAEHPLTESFAGNPQSGLTTANIYRYVEVRLPADSPTRTAFSYAHGPPAMIEHVYGSGRIVLVTTSLDDRWGSWAVWPSFLPMMHELTEYVIQGASSEPTLVGQPIHIDAAMPGALGQSALVRRPDGTTENVLVSASGDGSHVTIEDTRLSGVYHVSFGPQDDVARLFAVNVDTRESDLGTLNEQDLSASILGNIRYDIAESNDVAAPTSQRDLQGTKLSGWLLLAVVVLLFVEQVMAWNGRYGLIALLACPFVITGLAWMPSIGLVLAVVVLLAMAARRWKCRGNQRLSKIE